MGAKLVNATQDGTIPVCEMQQGQIGVITNSEGVGAYVGVIVVRAFHSIQCVGISTHFCDRRNEDFRVRILQPGEQIEIT